MERGWEGGCSELGGDIRCYPWVVAPLGGPLELFLPLKQSPRPLCAAGPPPSLQGML